jgi:hypothetical protein
MSNTLIFIENWDDGMGNARWSAPIYSKEEPAILDDGLVDYNFDYSTLSIPSAPNSTGGTTRGVSMGTNLIDQCPADMNCTGSDEGESIGIVPLGGITIPSGDFTFRTDFYHYNNGGSGSTEYATMGVYSNGSSVPLRFGNSPGSGLAWQWDGDGDSATDLLRYESPAQTSPPTTEYALGGYEDVPDGTVPGVPTGINSPVGPLNQWTEMEIESKDGIISWKMNGAILDQFDNTSGMMTGGTIIIGGSDPFNSVNSDYRYIFDNVVLECLAPEIAIPTLTQWGLTCTFLLLLIGGVIFIKRLHTSDSIY